MGPLLRRVVWSYLKHVDDISFDPCIPPQYDVFSKHSFLLLLISPDKLKYICCGGWHYACDRKRSSGKTLRHHFKGAVHDYNLIHVIFIAPHGPLAAHSVRALKTTIRTQAGNKHNGSDHAINNSSQSTHLFRSTEEWGVIWLVVKLKYQ